MICARCRTVFVDWQKACPACGKRVDRRSLAARTVRSLRRWFLACLLGAAGLVLLTTAYLLVSMRLPLSPWTVPLILEVLGRVNDHPAALGVLGEPVRARGLAT